MEYTEHDLQPASNYYEELDTDMWSEGYQRIMELESVYAYIVHSHYYCKECAMSVLGLSSRLELADMVYNGEVLTINENTVQYEQYAGETIPLEGIYCYIPSCNAELYAPMEGEE